MPPKTAMEYRDIMWTQAKVIKNLRDRMKAMAERAQKTINYCNDKGYEPSKLALSVIAEVDDAMFYLDNQSVKLMLKMTPEDDGGQTKLWEGHEGLRMRK